VSVLAGGLLGAASLLLLAAGAAKAVDSTRTAGALGALGWPSSPLLVRVGAGAEAALGAAGLAVGGAVVAGLVASSFTGFAVFVWVALRSGTPVGTCGCFGRADTPPRPSHVAVDLVLAAGAALAAATHPAPLVDAPAGAWPLAAAIAGASYLALTGRPGPGLHRTPPPEARAAPSPRG
jgi:hypothetical protein